MTAYRGVFALYGLFLAGCVTAAEKDAARSTYGDCVAKAVQRLDDGKTDPVSMAIGIAPQCGVEYQRMADTIVAEAITESGQNFARQTMRDNEIKTVTSAIIIFRSKGRQKS